jgi:hypothetical protein
VNDAGRILLAQDVQVKHLKRWTWRSWLAADIKTRALPWSQLILERGQSAPDLNLQWRQRTSGLFAVLLLPLFAWKVTRPLAALLLLLLLLLNWGFYRFLWRKRGLRFMLACIPLHWLYYLYSSAAFGLSLLEHIFMRDKM